MKNFNLLFLFILFLCSDLPAQFASTELSFGILYSQYRSEDPLWEGGKIWRRGTWINLNQGYIFHKNLKVEGGLTYQERMPLEFLPIETSNSITGDRGVTILANYPTHPQHEFFGEPGFLRIPNFKYLHLELIPMFTFGKKVTVSVGTGYYVGLLLNREGTTISKEDLPNVQHIFDQPSRDQYTKVEYNQLDLGLIPKFAIQYPLSSRVNIGVQVKYYYSLNRLNNFLVDFDGGYGNIKWEALAGGLHLHYQLF